MNSAEYAICEILRDGNAVGLGFAVDASHVLTCAHVLNAALHRDEREAADPGDQPFTLEFPIGRRSRTPERRSAVVAAWLPKIGAEFDLDDLALLRLVTPTPADVPALSAAAGNLPMRVQMWGPQEWRSDGGHVTGEVLGSVKSGRIQINVNNGQFRVRPGFSGGPVWQPGTTEVIGILAACGQGEAAVDAYLLGLDRITQLWPAWKSPDRHQPSGIEPLGVTATHGNRRARSGRRGRLIGAVIAAVIVVGGVAITIDRLNTRHDAPGATRANTARIGAGPSSTAPTGRASAGSAAVTAPYPPCGYHLAFIGALTGALGSAGTGMAQGAQLAIDQFNARYGADCVQLIRYDSQGSPSKARQVAHLVVADPQMLGVVGPTFSPESETADPILNAAGIPLVTPAATFADLAKKHWRVFHRAIGDDTDVPPAAARYIRDDLDARRVYVVDDHSAYGAGLANGIRTELGDLVVGAGVVAGDGKQTNFSTTVTDIISSGATVLVYGGYYANAGLLRRQLTAAGWEGTLVGGDAVRDPRFVTAAGVAAAQGTIIIAPDPPITAAQDPFAARYQAAFGSAPINSSDVSYDIANMFLQGIQKGHTTPKTMLTWINGYNATGVADHYQFTADGNLKPADSIIWTYTVTGGTFASSGAAPTT